MLAFFVAGAGVVWLWSLRLFGDLPAAVALGMFVCLPPVLGHAGLATTDMALAAMVVAALYAFVRWLEVASLRSSLALGLLAGLAVASKFSAVLFLAAGGVAVLLTAWAVERPSPGSIASGWPGESGLCRCRFWFCSSPCGRSTVLRSSRPSSSGAHRPVRFERLPTER